MDEATRTGRPAVEHKRGPEEIREDIEQTREELGETVEALAAKTDVKAQARAKLDETKERARETVASVKQRVTPAKVDELKEYSATADTHPAARSQQLRGAVASPATYVVIGALAGVLLGVVMTRR